MTSGSSLEQFLAMAAEYLVDGRTGILRSVTEVPRTAGSPELFHFVATRARGDVGGPGQSGGASTRREIALAKAIGEGIERYCAGSFDPSPLPLARFADAPFPCADPSTFALYTPEQLRQPRFPFVPFDDQTLVRWVEARDLVTDEACHVPAAKVFLPYRYDVAAGERPIVQTITTGLASHSNREDAVINAICEVVERDAFTLMWQARMSLPSIRVASLDAGNRDLIERFTRAGARVDLLNLALDHGVPTVLAVLRSGRPGTPALVFAACAAPSPTVAVQKALEELELMRAFAGWILSREPRLSDPDQVRGREDHVNFWCDAANAPAADFLFASSARQDLDELPSLATGDRVPDLRRLVDRIGSVGERVLVADLTPPELGELGITAVRAIIPGFHPLVFGHRLRALGGSRLWKVPQALGHPGVTPETGDNPSPHPFP